MNEIDKDARELHRMLNDKQVSALENGLVKEAGQPGPAADPVGVCCSAPLPPAEDPEPPSKGHIADELIFKVSDVPPPHLCILFGLQVSSICSNIYTSSVFCCDEQKKKIDIHFSIKPHT